MQIDTKEDPYIGKWVHPETTAPLDMVGRHGQLDMQQIAEYTAQLLELTPQDTLLDLCCGNGLLTRELALRTKSVLGFDYSPVLLEQAREISDADNIDYAEGDATKVAEALAGQRFDAVVLSAAFQYFDEQAGSDVLAGIAGVLKPGGRAAILDIPDREKRLGHQMRSAVRLLMPSEKNDAPASNTRFKSFGSRIRYLVRNGAHALGLRPGGDELGWWWRRTAFLDLARSQGFEARCIDPPAGSPHASYRFDAVLALRAKP